MTTPARPDRSPFRLFILLCLLSLCSVVSSATNRTIDDQHGDEVTGLVPLRTPSNEWNVGQACSVCNIHPEPSLMFDGTWLDATVINPDDVWTITLSFTGTAIYVFSAIPNSNPDDAATVVNVTFLLDGKPGTPYLHYPDTTSNILYNTSVFSQEGLANVPHTLVMRPTAGVRPSAFLFDYAIYTVEDSESSPTSSPATSPSSANKTSHSHIPVIVGTTLGAVALALLALLYFRLRTRRPKAEESHTTSTSMSNFVVHPLPPPLTTASNEQAGLGTNDSPRPLTGKAALMARQRAEGQRHLSPGQASPGSSISEVSDVHGEPAAEDHWAPLVRAPPAAEPSGSGLQATQEEVLRSRVYALELEAQYLRSTGQGSAPPAYASDTGSDRV